MKSEIEQIVSSDESARATVERSKKEAEQLLAKSRAKAAELHSGLEAQILTKEEKEIAPILADARKRAERIMEQSQEYIDELRNSVTRRQASIVDDFISYALGERPS